MIKKIHYLLIALSFIMPCVLYMVTMAPTVSLWDCGEFISTSVIMGIPHPPGTPLYLIISNFFSQIPIFSDIGARVNLVSPIASAFSVMFLYMIIVYLIELLTSEKHKESLIKNYAAFIGAMTFAVTDAHWFNAVESEVYALSTFFTAIVVWLILKWAKNYNDKSSVKYLILIAYCLGLAIGIHLLNLLAIPFIALIIYFKSIQKISFYNICILILGTAATFIVIYLGIIKGLPSFANATNSIIIVVLFIVVTITAAIIVNIDLGKNFGIKYSAWAIFSVFLIFLTVHQIIVTDYKAILQKNQNELYDYRNDIIKEMNEAYTELNLARQTYDRTKHELDKKPIEIYQSKLDVLSIKEEISVSFIKDADHKKNLFNKNGIGYFDLIKKQSFIKIFLGLLFITVFIAYVCGILLVQEYKNNRENSSRHNIGRIIINATLLIIIGYSTYSLIFIRAQQNPKINYNNPHDIRSVYDYINRDQYGDWDITDREKSLLVNSQQNNESWRRYIAAELDDNGNIIYPKEASSSEVRKFVWNYQFKEMYFRYFGWQFIGKEKWEDRSWTRNAVNDIDGDGEKDMLHSLPPLQSVDATRYHLDLSGVSPSFSVLALPLAFLIGLIGFFYHALLDWRRWLSVKVLFILTGIAIVIYLNQSDPQPRERDYAYVGSFFAFSIWIGIGCYAILSGFVRGAISKLYSQGIVVIPAILLFVLMPLLMGVTDYYEHDRSKRFEAWDYAYNLLNSCDPDAILFTNGDNDTFPLWYMQEVENIRTDVKVVNLSLLNFSSYIRQLDQHEPNLKMFEYNQDYLEAIDTEKIQEYAYKNWVVDIDENSRREIINIETENGINFNWEFKGGTYGLGMTNITIMKIIEICFGKNPIYFSTTTGNNNLGLDDYLIQEGLVYRLVDKKDTELYTNELISVFSNYGIIDEIKINTDKSIKMITKASGEPIQDNGKFVDLNKNGVWDKELIIRTKEDYIEYQEWLEKYPEIGTYRYTNLDKDGIYYGPNIERIASNYRNVFFNTATLVALNNKNYLEDIDKSLKIINLAHNYYPDTYVPAELSYDIGVMRYCQALFQMIDYKRIPVKEEMQKKINNLLKTVTPDNLQKFWGPKYQEIYGNSSG